MAKLLNADYWKKAYLLEFKINGVLTDAFTFSVPPENEEFSFPQRKSETKTFGGAVVADYGNDLVQINLSGSTINQELKLIYKSSLGRAEMTGEQEIFYLRDLLTKYGSRENLQGKEVYLYSLSGGGKVSKHNPKWWKIYVGQLDVNRSKDKPFCYNYKFSATGAPEVTSKKNIFGNGYKSVFGVDGNTIKGWYEKIEEINASLTKCADTIEEYGGGFLEELSGYLSTAHFCIDSFNNVCKRYTEAVNGILSDVKGIAVDTLALGDKVIYSACRYYATLAADVWNSCLDVVDAFKDIGNYCSNIGETYSDSSWNNFVQEEFFSSSSWQSVKELFDDSVSDQDIVDAYSSVAHEGVINANRAITITSKYLDNYGVAIIPGSADEDDQVISTYGYKNVNITDAETSWDQIAQDYYGNSSLSVIIASYNNLPDDKKLTAGQSILIPKLNFAESRISNNEVYNTPDIKDNYGKDLIIKNSDFSVYNGDIALVGGIDNLQQALLNRYSTLVGARIRLEVYGIQATIGDAVKATSALIQSSVHQTTVEDPRVENVGQINFVGMGDELTVSVEYTDINSGKRNLGGVI